ncbi:hypothetical protein QRO08_03810 [Paracidovorax citrulli]|uniref:Uncharacterized protein n=2 Tax=Paracidovorax citrulli TaxID=80869 RepID=A1TR66_PARC0|nr:LamG-like jellyroll fold domain-containing protein [Paracidovorax citrulli]ABM33454.1 hypothetical protein Aave_2886 [Paracidovorax citrulli AAC00-1]ABM34636.1 hypothetical protein Aave_4095 [Paracidovorax citrulli AAC00-1]ATG92637.1 hypothetical protein CQB05_00055 [Paracidovorax citrulli]ATG94078.1 hypothetical protein CQB05_08595 [Paracidovorax citrulli]MVT37344.1 hypothetical protein [Paracidovorax citrulli]
MAARYWRVIGLRTDGATGVAITQAALWGATGMIDAVLSASHAPASGSLAYLTDGDLADTTTWGQAQVSAPGFALVWDAGAAVDAVNVRFGSADDSAQWVRVYTLQSSSDRAAWNTVGTYVMPWPGARVLAPMPSTGDPLADKVVALLMFDGGTLADTSPSGGAWTASGGAAVVSSGGIGDSGALSLNGSADCFISQPLSSRWAFGSGDFCVEAYVRWSGGDCALVSMRYAAAERWSNVIRLANGVLQWSNGTAWLGGSTTLPTNIWTHVAVARVASTLRHFIGGTKVYEVGDTTPISGDRPCFIGAYDAFRDSSLNGMVDFVRITSGAGRYTEDFVPPTGVGGGASYPSKATPADLAIALGAVDGAMTQPWLSGAEHLARDVQFGGAGRIWGTTKTKGTPNVPTKARVVLLHQRSKVVARETWSMPATGAFEFAGIDTRQQFLVLAEDVQGNFRPVAASRLVPEVAP